MNCSDTSKSGGAGKCKDSACGPGVCPGIAMLMSFIVGSGISYITGIEWLTLPVTIILSLVLISGVYRRILPRSKI